MKSRVFRLPRLLDLLLRMFIGAVFVYAGWLKLADPQALADSVASFQILPRALVVPLALGLPPFELACGSLLILGWPRRVAALAVLLVTGIFCVALLSAVVRGITIDCGCFGQAASGTPTVARMWQDLGRDVLLLLGSAVLYGVGCARPFPGSGAPGA